MDDHDVSSNPDQDAARTERDKRVSRHDSALEAELERRRSALRERSASDQVLTSEEPTTLESTPSSHEHSQRQYQAPQEHNDRPEDLRSETSLRKRKPSASFEPSSSPPKRLRSDEDVGGHGETAEQSDGQANDTQEGRPVASRAISAEHAIPDSTGSRTTRGPRVRGNKRAGVRLVQPLSQRSEGSSQSQQADRDSDRPRLPSPPPPSRLHELNGAGRDRHSSLIRAFKSAQVRMPWLYGRRRRRKHWSSQEDYRKDAYNLSHTWNAECDLNRLRERFNLTPQPVRPPRQLTMMDLELVELGYWLSVEPTDPAPDHSLWNSVPEWAETALDMYHDFLRDADLPQLPLFARQHQPSTASPGKSSKNKTESATVRQWHLDALKDALGSRREQRYDDPNDPYNASGELDEAYRALGDLLDAEGDAVAPARQRLAEVLQRPEHGGEEDLVESRQRSIRSRNPPEPMGRGTPPRPAWIHKGSLPARRHPARLLANIGRSRSETPFHRRPSTSQVSRSSPTLAPLRAPSSILGSSDAPRRKHRRPLDAFPPVDRLKPPPNSAFSSYSVEQLDKYKAQLEAEAAALDAEDDDALDDADDGNEDDTRQSVEQDWSSDQGDFTLFGGLGSRPSAAVDASGIIDPHQRRAFEKSTMDPAFMTEDEQLQQALRLSKEAASDSPHGASLTDSRMSTDVKPDPVHTPGIPSDDTREAWDRFNSSDPDDMTDEQQLELALKMSLQEASQDLDELDDEQQLDLAIRMSMEEASQDTSSEPLPPQPSTPTLSPRALPSSPHPPPHDDFSAPDDDDDDVVVPAMGLGPDADETLNADPRYHRLPRKIKCKTKRQQRAHSLCSGKCTGSRTFSVVAREVMKREERFLALQIQEDRRRSWTHVSGANTPASRSVPSEVARDTTPAPSSQDGRDVLEEARERRHSPASDGIRGRRRGRRRSTQDDDWMNEQLDPTMTEDEWRLRIAIIQQLRELPQHRPNDRWLTPGERRIHEESEIIPRQSSHYGPFTTEKATNTDTLNNRARHDSFDDAETRRRSDRYAQEQDPVALVQAAMNNAQASDPIEREDPDAAQEIERVLTSREAIRQRARAILRDEAQVEVEPKLVHDSLRGQRQTSQQHSSVEGDEGQKNAGKESLVSHKSVQVPAASKEHTSAARERAPILKYAASVSETVKNAFQAASRRTAEKQALVPGKDRIRTPEEGSKTPPDVLPELEPLYRIFQESPDSGISWHEFITGVQGMAPNNLEAADKSEEENVQTPPAQHVHSPPATWSAEWFAQKLRSSKESVSSEADRPPSRGKDTRKTVTITQTSPGREREGTPAPWVAEASDPAPQSEAPDAAPSSPMDDEEDEDDEDVTPNLSSRAEDEQARKERLADEWAPRLRCEPWSESLEWWLRWAIKAGFLDRLIEQKKRREERKRKREESDQERDNGDAAEDETHDGNDDERDRRESSPSKKRK